MKLTKYEHFNISRDGGSLVLYFIIKNELDVVLVVQASCHRLSVWVLCTVRAVYVPPGPLFQQSARLVSEANHQVAVVEARLTKNLTDRVSSLTKVRSRTLSCQYNTKDRRWYTDIICRNVDQLYACCPQLFHPENREMTAAVGRQHQGPGGDILQEWRLRRRLEQVKERISNATPTVVSLRITRKSDYHFEVIIVPREKFYKFLK